MPLYDHKSQTAFLNRRLAAGKLLLTALLTAGALIALPLMSASPALASGAGSDTLGSGQALYGGQALVAANGQYSLAMQTDGNLVVYNACHSPLWYTGKLTGQNVPGSYVVMQSDGNFVLYSPSNQPLWYTGKLTGQNVPGSYVVMQSDGSLVLRSASGSLLWSSNGGGSSTTALQVAARAERYNGQTEIPPGFASRYGIGPHWSGFCESFVALVAYNGQARYGSALIDYRARLSAGLIHTTGVPPRGAIVYWNPSQDSVGHVGISLGGGQEISTYGYQGWDAPIQEHPYLYFKNYLGWAMPY